MMTLALAVGFAVLGVAGAASAHHNTVTGTVTCKQGGGWTVTWTIANSETISETITQSNRTAVLPVGTVIGGSQTRTVTETVTTKPTSAINLTVQGKWVRDGQNIYSTNGDSVEVGEFSDGCNVTTVTAPSVPVVDDCGPGNARFGTVPSGPWTSTSNADGSLTITADPGYTFPNGQRSVTYPEPTDSNVACPTPPTTNPPVVTPPVTTPPEVLPAQVLVVRAGARRIDKCGRQGDLFKVAKRDGVVYTAKGKALRQGVWLKARTRTVTVRATAADASYRLQGRSVWTLTFTRKACAQAPEVAPHTGA
ncbi:hypothetical protein L2K70_17635 [Nocardioides KLBMP 9356]|uniref:Uncharacterized protein n=1 Tax=Nocardioides potassii TaxID=2911371 RepID=A0ABS9HE70_9ACTN|nr:hypothetical protein [Nocardioides potassii]MCF6379436.1 hypothetical protein [Nocardioides potassii]